MRSGREEREEVEMEMEMDVDGSEVKMDDDGWVDGKGGS